MVKKTHRLRVLLVAFVSLTVFIGIEARLYYVQIHQHRYYADRARGQHYLVEKVYPRRGDILDREEQTLATSTSFQTIYFSPPRAPRKKAAEGADAAAASPETGPEAVPEWRKPLTPEVVAELARLIGRSEADVRKVLSRTRRSKLVEKIPPETAQAVRLFLGEHRVRQDLFALEEQGKRLYPKDELVATIVGIAGNNPYGENRGLDGLELYYNTTLSGEMTSQTLQITNRHGELEALDDQTMRRAYGSSLVLTLDGQIQRAAREALRTQMERVKAESGVVLAMDVRTGGILAMVSLPDFNPNDIASAPRGNMRNRALTDPIEIGSVMKILTTTILLDNNLLSVDEMIDCQNGYGVIDGRAFRDSHPLGVVPFRLAFAESSNIGMATLGLRIEPKLYYESLRRFGMGAPVGIDLPGESSGVLRPVSQWSRLSRTSLPVGYETSLTALQVVTAVGAIANKGIRMQPQIVDRILSVEGRTLEDIQPREVARVASEATCRTILDLMKAVVDEGTGKKARVPGYSVAGKTGTTRKQASERRYIASFAGIIPADDPRLAIYCFVNEPDHRIDFYGGSVAAPVFAEVAAEAVRILGIPPDQPIPATPVLAEGGESEEDADRELVVADGGPVVREELEGVAIFDAPAPGTDPPPTESTQWAAGAAHGDLQPAVMTGVMPNCLGQTMAEVLELSAQADLPLKMVGSGVAIQQSPPPGTPMMPGRQAIVVFAAPSQALAAEHPAEPQPAPAAPPGQP